MKTISGKSISSNSISLSKAAKILSKFVSAENGASQAISAYLERASTSFNELNQLHKELRAPHSECKHKRHRSETTNNEDKIVGKPNQNDEISQELKLNHGALQSGNKLRRRKLKSENMVKGEENPNRGVFELGQEPNNGFRDYVGMEGETEKHGRKKENKKQDVGSGNNVDNGGEHGDKVARGKLVTDAEESHAWSVDSGRELRNRVEGNVGIESKAKKHKKEKKKIKDDTGNFSGDRGEVDNEEGEGGVKTKVLQILQRKQRNNGEGEKQGLTGSVGLQSKKKKRSGTGTGAGAGGKMIIEQVMVEERKKRKKRKNADGEVGVVHGSEEPWSKKKKRRT